MENPRNIVEILSKYRGRNNITFVQIAADEYVDVGKVGFRQHLEWVFRQKQPVHGGCRWKSQDAGVAIPLLFRYDTRIDGPKTRHGADGVVGQRGRVALAVVQQLFRYVDCPFAGHVAPGCVYRSGLDDPASHQTLGHR